MQGRTSEHPIKLFVFDASRREEFCVTPATAARVRALLGVPVSRRRRSPTGGRSVVPSVNKGRAERGYGACALSAARFNAGMTQAFLAQATGIQQPHLSAMESGKRPISQLAAQRLGLALECDWEDLVQL